MQTVEKEKTFTIHTLETAPEASKGLLDDSKKSLRLRAKFTCRFSGVSRIIGGL